MYDKNEKNVHTLNKKEIKPIIFLDFHTIDQ